MVRVVRVVHVHEQITGLRLVYDPMALAPHLVEILARLHTRDGTLALEVEIEPHPEHLETPAIALLAAAPMLDGLYTKTPVLAEVLSFPDVEEEAGD